MCSQRNLEKTTSRRSAARLHEIVENMSSAMEKAQRPGSERHECVCGAFVLRKRKPGEDGGGYLVRDGVCLLLQQGSGGIKRARAAAPIERSLSKVLGELLSEK